MGLIYFFLLLGGLIFFHEFGHFIVARACGVRVLVFSLGFGPRWTVYRSKRSGTEYCVSVLPLGGYVKMLGEDPTEPLSPHDRADAFNHQTLWKRILIVSAGPVFNLILPVFIFFFLGLSATALPPAEMGMVLQNGPAWEGGLRAGDRIVAIDGEPVQYWYQLHEHIANSATIELKVEIQRGDERITTTVVPRLYEDVRVRDIGMVEHRGQIRVGSDHIKTIVHVDAGSGAAAAGLSSWDRIVAVNDVPVDRWYEMDRMVRVNQGRSLKLLALQRQDWAKTGGVEVDAYGAEPVEVTLQVPSDAMTARDMGLASAEAFVYSVRAGTPATRLSQCHNTCAEESDCALGWICAELADGSRCVAPCDSNASCDGACQQIGGRELCVPSASVLSGADPRGALVRGDELVSMDGEPVQRWSYLLMKLHDAPDRIHSLRIRKESGEEHLSCVVPVEELIRNEFNAEESRIVFGAENLSEIGFPDPIPNDDLLAYAGHRAIWDTWDSLKINVFAIAGLFRGTVPVDQLGGPIFIGQLAAKTEERGMRWFFGIMVMLSINLGLLNLLPIPMLDGGHLLFLGIEAVKRQPVSIRTRQIAAYLGLSIIFLLMVLVFKNDLNRLLGGM